MESNLLKDIIEKIEKYKNLAPTTNSFLDMEIHSSYQEWEFLTYIELPKEYIVVDLLEKDSHISEDTYVRMIDSGKNPVVEDLILGEIKGYLKGKKLLTPEGFNIVEIEIK